MPDIDLNLITPLDALLTERSVTAAAKKLGLSTSAMSRTLARLRVATGDPLLVSAGRALVPTPYAEAMAERVHEIAREARAVLQPAANVLDLATLERTFVIRANDGFIDLAAGALTIAAGEAAPGVRLQFVPKPDKDAHPLREGMIDLEIGVLGATAPELRTRLLFADRFVGVCRRGHPALADGGMTTAGYVACRHVVVSRKRQWTGPVDTALDKLGLFRTVALVVPSHANAMRIVRDSDLVGLVPFSCLGGDADRHGWQAAGLTQFDLPVQTPGIKVSVIWHPRHQADPAHRWLRDTVVDVTRSLTQ